MTNPNSDKLKKEIEMSLNDSKEAHKTGRSLSDTRETLMVLDIQSYLVLPKLLLHSLLFLMVGLLFPCRQAFSR